MAAEGDFATGVAACRRDERNFFVALALVGQAAILRTAPGAGAGVTHAANLHGFEFGVRQPLDVVGLRPHHRSDTGSGVPDGIIDRSYRSSWDLQIGVGWPLQQGVLGICRGSRCRCC